MTSPSCTDEGRADARFSGKATESGDAGEDKTGGVCSRTGCRAPVGGLQRTAFLDATASKEILTANVPFSQASSLVSFRPVHAPDPAASVLDPRPQPQRDQSEAGDTDPPGVHRHVDPPNAPTPGGHQAGLSPLQCEDDPAHRWPLGRVLGQRSHQDALHAGGHL